MKSIHVLVLVAGLSAAGLHAQQHAPAGATAQGGAGAGAARDLLSEGEVRKVDVARGKITLRHGPLANLDMPAMTMVFRAADPELLDGLQVGDKVRFTAERKNGSFVVTAIQPRSGPSPAATVQPAQPAPSALPIVDAVVEQVDPQGGLLVLKHHEIPNLGMEAMTMGFMVADKRMLAAVKAGDRVKFQSDMVGGEATVVWIEPVR